MELSELKKRKLKLIKDSLLNVNNIIFIVLVVVVLVLNRNNKNVLFALILLAIVFVLEIIAFIIEYKTIKDIYLYKNRIKEIKSDGYLIDKKRLINIIKDKGIPFTYIEINKELYSIEVSKYKKTCDSYIDYNHYKDTKEIENLLGRNTSKNIKVLLVNGENPRNYLE